MIDKTLGLGAAMDRRRFLQRLAGGAAIGAGLIRSAGAQEDELLRSLIEQNVQSELDPVFDAGSRTIQMPKATLPTLSTETINTTEAAVARYQNIVADGGWPFVKPVERLRVGMRNPSVSALRQRLMVSGDLVASAGTSDVFDSFVEAGVKRFQARHGMPTDGVVREAMFTALNVPAQARLNQLRINQRRLENFASKLSDRYAVVNIPAARVEAIEGGLVVSRHACVAGKPDRPSPELTSRIVEINFNPYWTVPVSIVRKDLIPKMQAEPDYLQKNRIRILDGKGNELAPAQINWYSEEAVNYRFKQDPGDFNSLGSMRINFPSNHGVYMHDTPLKNLFGEDFRFHSSGCVRIQNVRELVNWLLMETPNWSREEIDQVVRSGERKDARIVRPVPLYWIYVTAWATGDGVVQFRDDIYGKDGLGQYARG